jgi:hypothetical protein
MKTACERCSPAAGTYYRDQQRLNDPARGDALAFARCYSNDPDNREQILWL